MVKTGHPGETRPMDPERVAARRTLPLVFAAATVLIHLSFAGRYDWFRDELYFLACGRRLAWGYVDQPPLIALVSRAAFALGGGNLAAYRLPAALAHAGLVYLCGRFAQREGGTPLAAGIACLCALCSPLLVVEGYLLTMNAFEPLIYLGVAMLVASLLRGGSQRLWVGVGALTGLALLNKHSFAFYAAPLLIALAATRPRALASRWLVAGVALAALIVLPHALWQVRNGFPMLELLSAQKWKNAPWSLRSYLLDQVLQLDPVIAAVAVAGAAALWRSDLRALSLAYLLQLVLFAALKGKAYYLTAAYPPLMAVGAVSLARLPRAGWAVASLVAASGVALAPLVVPVLSPEGLIRWEGALHVQPTRLENKEYGALPQHLADEFGLREISQAVEEAAARLSPEERAHAAVYAQNYGEAAALELFGSGGLPVISGHNSYFLWGVPAGTRVVLVVGGRTEEHQRVFSQVTEVARARDDQYAMPYERARAIHLCREPRLPLSEVWPRVKHYE